MPAMGNIYLRSENGSHVLMAPVKDIPFPHWRSNISGAGLDAQSRLEVKWDESAKTDSVRVNLKLEIPVMDVIPAGSVDATGRTAAPRVAYQNAGSCTFTFHRRATQGQRADLVRQIAHLLIGADGSGGEGLAVGGSTANLVQGCASSQPIPYALTNLLFPGN